MDIRQVSITPAIAAEWLQNNTCNRKISKTLVNQLAGEIATGNFKTNGETIIFSRNGTLLDGQHRLLAVIKAERPITTFVVRGPEDDVFDTINVGKTRRAKDVLDIAREENTSVLGSTLTIAWKYLNDALGRAGKYPCNRERMEVLANHPRLRESVQFGITLKEVMPPATAAFLHYFGAQVDKGKTEQFLERVRDGVGLLSDDPSFVLREALLKRGPLAAKSRTGQHNKQEHVAIAVKALNAFLTDTRIRQLRMGGKEGFPRIIGSAKIPSFPLTTTDSVFRQPLRAKHVQLAN